MKNSMAKPLKKIAEGLFELPDGCADKGYLVGTRCRSCGTIAFPAKVVCPICLEDDSSEKIPLSRRGILFSYSVNQMAPEGFEAPYITGKVDLAEKVRIFSVITGCAPREESLRIGMEMEIVFEPMHRDAEGNDVIGYRFKPVAD